MRGIIIPVYSIHHWYALIMFDRVHVIFVFLANHFIQNPERVFLLSLELPQNLHMLGTCSTHFHGDCTNVNPAFLILFDWLIDCPWQGRNAKSAIHRAAMRGRAQIIQRFLKEEVSWLLQQFYYVCKNVFATCVPHYKFWISKSE